MGKIGPDSAKGQLGRLKRGQEPVPLPGGIAPDRELPELRESENQDGGVVRNHRDGPGHRRERVMVDED